jgi:hypothetical protein
MKALHPLYAVAVVAMGFALASNPEEQPTTATLDGIAATKAELRTDAGKQRACGPNASWREIDETTIQCVTKKNRPTVKVSL